MNYQIKYNELTLVKFLNILFTKMNSSYLEISK